MLLTIPVPAAALTTYSTRPKKKLKSVDIVGASYLFAKVNSAPSLPRSTFSSSATTHSDGSFEVEVKSIE